MKALLRCTVQDQSIAQDHTLSKDTFSCYNVGITDVVDACYTTYVIPSNFMEFDKNDEPKAWIRVQLLSRDEYGSTVVLPTRSTENVIGRTIITVSSFDITFSVDV